MVPKAMRRCDRGADWDPPIRIQPQLWLKEPLLKAVGHLAEGRVCIEEKEVARQQKILGYTLHCIRVIVASVTAGGFKTF